MTAVIMNEYKIDPKIKNLAISLYAVSKTAKTGLGAEVLKKLRELSDNRFQFATLPLGVDGATDEETIYVTSNFDPGQSPTTIPLSEEDKKRYKKLEDQLKGIYTPPPSPPSGDQKLTLISLQFTHEGAHLVKSRELFIETELHAERITSNYYQEIKANLIRYQGKTYTVRSGNLEGKEEIMRRGRLVDWLIQDRAKQTKLTSKDITGQWIINHITFWGGISNREIDTCKIYLDVLIRDLITGFPQGQELILKLMERIPARELKNFLKPPLLDPSLLGSTFLQMASVDRQQRLLAIGRKVGINFSPLRDQPPDAGVARHGPPRM